MSRSKFIIDDNGRECPKCGKYKEWDCFENNRHSPKGKTSQCKLCKNKYREEHKEAIRESRAKYNKNNKEFLYESKKKWFENNKEQHAKSRLKYVNKKYLEDSTYRIEIKLRSRINSAIKSQSSTKQDRTHKIIGCSYSFLKQHLEATNDWGFKIESKGYHIDHIIPCSYFNLQDEVEQRVCFNWRNLQLLPALKNIHKRDTTPNNVEEMYNELKTQVLNDVEMENI